MSSLNIIVIIIVIWIGTFIYRNKQYKKTSYYQVTKQPYILLKYNKGRYGEYLIYNAIKNFETRGAKFLFNIYVPTKNRRTSEIDVLMICSKGIFVFESKNYKGWIYGNENRNDWYQTLLKGKGRTEKHIFYNPILQNQKHIKHLQYFLKENIPMWSVIVFSNRCRLKNKQKTSSNVVYQYNLVNTVSRLCNENQREALSDRDIEIIYNTLYPYSQVDKATKIKHIQNCG